MACHYTIHTDLFPASSRIKTLCTMLFALKFAAELGILLELLCSGECVIIVFFHVIVRPIRLDLFIDLKCVEVVINVSILSNGRLLNTWSSGSLVSLKMIEGLMMSSSSTLSFGLPLGMMGLEGIEPKVRMRTLIHFNSE